MRISGSNAGYTMFRGSVKGTGYPLHSPVSPSLAVPCVTVCNHISTGVYPQNRKLDGAHSRRTGNCENNLLPLTEIEDQFIGHPARPTLRHCVTEIPSLKSLYYAFISLCMSNITKSSTLSLAILTPRTGGLAQ